jgi:hypothetical protein
MLEAVDAGDAGLEGQRARELGPDLLAQTRNTVTSLGS